MKLARTAITALRVVAYCATSCAKLRVVRITTFGAGPPPGHGWPRTKTQCWLITLPVTTRCHARHGFSHSGDADRPWWSQRAAQCSGAQWTWDFIVLLALFAHLVSTLGAVAAHTGTCWSRLAHVRPCATFVALPFLWRWVRHGSFSDGRTEQRMFNALA
jgi:hypothetical protein